jgi:hypothetical protein
MSISKEDLLDPKWLDGQILANPYTTYYLEKLMHMEQQELALNNVWRLEITANGSYKLNDFTLPTNDVIINKMHTKDKVPKWMLESLAVLQILDNGESIADVGKKIDESIFYLLEPKD